MNALIAKNITVAMGQKIICKDLTIQFNPGEIWGILGPNGSGKTTFLHALANLHPITQGEIFLGHKSSKYISAKSIAQSLGVLFQHLNLIFSQTVWEFCLTSRFPHLNFLKKETDEDKHIVQQALEVMDLYHYRHRKINQLSGGEKQRLALAALLAQTPKIYLLDEPTNHLDFNHQMHVLTHFRQLAKNQSASIIMSLHDINLAQQFCDHTLLLYPDGETLQGKTYDVFTAANLSRLYQYSLKEISYGNSSFWFGEIPSLRA